jgi:hypothetical protein
VSKTFPEFDDRKHVITVDKVPEWLDSTCFFGAGCLSGLPGKLLCVPAKGGPSS